MARAPPLHLLLHLLSATTFINVPDSYASGHSTADDNGLEVLHDPTYPAPRPAPAAPTCTVPVFKYSFGDMRRLSVPKAEYEPPSACPAPWSLIVLAFSASCEGRQKNRVGSVWLDRVELLRTTIAEPTESRVSWEVNKDVTRFSGLFRSPPNGIFSVMLDNVHNDAYTGVCEVSVSLKFYGTQAFVADPQLQLPPPKIPESYFQLPDQVMPIAEATCESCERGYWFRIENASDGFSKAVTVPSRTYRAVLEVFVSSHGYDKFWPSNPSELYIKENNLTNKGGNGAYREVVVAVDSHFVGSFPPFPVIHTESINQKLWQPVVALGAFDLPSSDVELTPFLGLLLDGKPHILRVSVVDVISEWLIGANLHLWLDPSSTSVSAGLWPSKTPCLSISRKYWSQVLNGTFNTHGKRTSFFSGWVNSSFGNLTTEVVHELELRSFVKFTGNGLNKTVDMTAEQKTELRVRDDNRKVLAERNFKAKYPLRFTERQIPKEGGTNVEANIIHELNHESQKVVGDKTSSEKVENTQKVWGWKFVDNNGKVTNSSGNSNQKYVSGKDGSEYEREISVADNKISSDRVTERSESCCIGCIPHEGAAMDCSNVATA